jgi:hypothetical protein
VSRDVIDEPLDGVSLIVPSTSNFDVAGRLGPAELCSLDAAHRAPAGVVGPDLEDVGPYDRLVTMGARAAGFLVVQS